MIPHWKKNAIVFWDFFVFLLWNQVNIRKNCYLEEPITLETLSAQFFSPYYFHKLFSIIVGKSLAAYIRDRRVLFACDQLCRTEKSILEHVPL